MKFLISPNKKQTDVQSFLHGNNTLTFIGFKSAIVGLKLNLNDANGSTQSKSIFDTAFGFKLDISKYGSIEFEYLSTDKEYTIDLKID